MKWEALKKGCVKRATEEITLDLFWICDNKLKNMVMLLPTSSQQVKWKTHNLNHDFNIFCSHNQLCVRQYKVNV